jgi:hypothetical protein
VYFRYQPPYGTYERYGVYLRDDCFAGFEDPNMFEGKGNCYAMTWDTDDGRLRCCKVVDGTITDFLSPVQYVTGSGWHTMRIEAEGTNIRYYLDGALRISATDSSHYSGPCGIAYDSHMPPSYPAARGAYFDNFQANAFVTATASDWTLY